MSLSPKREGRLTASSFAAAIGLNPYMSKQKLFRELTNVDPKFQGNEMTAWGNDHEQDAVNRYEAEYGVILSNTGDAQDFIICTANDWIGCTPDGFNDEIVTEFKCPFSLRVYPEIPAYYMPQVQGQMAIAKKQLSHFACWTPDDFGVWEVKFNQEYWEIELSLLKKFYGEWKSGEQPARGKKPVMPDVIITRIY